MRCEISETEDGSKRFAEKVEEIDVSKEHMDDKSIYFLRDGGLLRNFHVIMKTMIPTKYENLWRLTFVQEWSVLTSMRLMMSLSFLH